MSAFGQARSLWVVVLALALAPACNDTRIGGPSLEIMDLSGPKLSDGFISSDPGTSCAETWACAKACPSKLCADNCLDATRSGSLDRAIAIRDCLETDCVTTSCSNTLYLCDACRKGAVNGGTCSGDVNYCLQDSN
jgi:hypothetical protein